MRFHQILAYCLLACLPLVGKAQIKAITAKGETVILREDGTWEYAKGGDEPIPTNKAKFARSKEATFPLKSKQNNTALCLNPALWLYGKAEHNPAAEFEIKSKEGNIFATVITEAVATPLETMKFATLTNAKKADPKASITKAEYREVNGAKVIFMELKGTVEKLELVYAIYVFSGEECTTQVIAYTTPKVYAEQQAKIFDLLNGLVVLKK